MPSAQSLVSYDVDSNILSCLNPSPKSMKITVAHESTIRTHMGLLHVPVELPRNHPNCARVDLKLGLWFHCNFCNTEVKGRSDCPFTIGQCNEHINSGSAHSKRLEEMNSVVKVREMNKNRKVCIPTISYDGMKSIFMCIVLLSAIEQNWYCFAQKWQ